jgi:hypothetical protein
MKPAADTLRQRQPRLHIHLSSRGALVKISLSTRRIALCLALLCSAATPVHAQELSAAVADRPVFALPAPAPIVDLGLPDGRSQVTANFGVPTETHIVTLCGNGGPEYFHWQRRPWIEPAVAPAAARGPSVQ